MISEPPFHTIQTFLRRCGPELIVALVIPNDRYVFLLHKVIVKLNMRTFTQGGDKKGQGKRAIVPEHCAADLLLRNFFGNHLRLGAGPSVAHTGPPSFIPMVAIEQYRVHTEVCSASCAPSVLHAINTQSPQPSRLRHPSP